MTAPGGDSVFGRTTAASNGRVLSTWPPYIPCSRKVTESTSDPVEPTAVYCYVQGTSMASPHAAGVAALIVSGHPNLGPNGVKALLDMTADPQPCPVFLPPGYTDIGAGFDSGLFFPCQGGIGNNSWYGSGQVDALNAVSR